MLTPLCTAMLETALNAALYRDRALQSGRQRLAGRVLQISLAELEDPFFLIFSQRQVDVLALWEGAIDCQVTMRLSVLPQLHQRRQLAALMQRGELRVDGDIQVVQQLVALLDLAEWAPAELLAPYTGDIVAQGLCSAAQRGGRALLGSLRRQRHYVHDTLIEEWRLAPGTLELAWFQEEIAALQRQASALEQRLARLEKCV
ncbi:SCP2 domain-containing protein [Edwardsiella ictaluri]|uniref:Ubiquinone biosynthesis accessory factor UbiJ n=1 Tax=Edwardsiella ictaluri (strain 93-146) TaxID=634503 RepID=C5BCA5_EDWI9|nr:SCP2 domain-containing protein [Edwardsiella ictaluri]ACR67396.1 SCP-2 sterol transfer family [Edwardsiella ictaluri 93-146]ARD39978.1 SCP2 domain-containing protein [Edwardsiella ictaluri]AVZ82100.1 SCP2 domain-containing protein [Edwardsiella ictaluri]EKS7762728.1 SCP2 domain-containing protein [Edwardsiella ictaluri]EKS7769639.1 SCP2 domain-containing protein [Edwardsiella ictaluri]